MQLGYYTACLGFMQLVIILRVTVHPAGLLFIQLVIMQLLRVQVAGYYAAGLLYRLFIIPLG